ncbi:MAG: MFS transporter [Cyclobacteriaceae bacterium]|nr:MFS transporter [Cyclobacteriaceae bacterium]UYN85367.1 MAG: MFS transporter [Cyclobacteriaceae bacterium]
MARTLDRLGKGIRTGARDAMLSDEATSETKGRVFGLHRAMDTLGAVVGPLLALLFLYIYPQHYKALFLIAFIPGVIAISFTSLLKEKSKHITKVDFRGTSVFAFARYWNESLPSYKRLVAGLLAFALINSSDVFLLLKVKESGMDDTVVIGVYIFYNLIYALTAYPMGRLSDRIGFKKTFIMGLTFFLLVYAGMAFGTTLVHFLILFTIYGLFAAATESVAKAWITNISHNRDTATAIGTYTGFQSVFTMMASIIAGWLWMAYGASTVFLLTSFFTALVVLYFLLGGINEKSVTE